METITDTKKKYTVQNGTNYDANTPKAVINALERARQYADTERQALQLASAMRKAIKEG